MMRKAIRPPTMDMVTMSHWASDEIDPLYWKRLIYSHPEEICRKAIVSYCKKEEAYFVNFLENTYSIYPFRRELAKTARKRSRSPARKGKISFGEALILLNYLLEAKEIPTAERWITEKDLPGGITFFQGPHQLTREPVLERYGRG